MSHKLYSGKCFFCKEYVSLSDCAFDEQPVCASVKCKKQLLHEAHKLGIKLIKENFYPPKEIVFSARTKIILAPTEVAYKTQVHAYAHFKFHGSMIEKLNYEQQWKESTIWN